MLINIKQKFMTYFMVFLFKWSGPIRWLFTKARRACGNQDARNQLEKNFNMSYIYSNITPRLTPN